MPIFDAKAYSIFKNLSYAHILQIIPWDRVFMFEYFLYMNVWHKIIMQHKTTVS